MRIDRHEDVWLRTARPTHHVCNLPGWRERRKHKAKDGARWKCGLCKQVWEWTRSYNDDMFKSWNRVDSRVADV